MGLVTSVRDLGRPVPDDLVDPCLLGTTRTGRTVADRCEVAELWAVGGERLPEDTATRRSSGASVGPRPAYPLTGSSVEVVRLGFSMPALVGAVRFGQRPPPCLADDGLDDQSVPTGFLSDPCDGHLRSPDEVPLPTRCPPRKRVPTTLPAYAGLVTAFMRAGLLVAVDVLTEAKVLIE